MLSSGLTLLPVLLRLEEMQRMSGSEVSRAELQRKFSLPVFTVSGMDYQKLSGIREGDGDPKVTSADDGRTA